MENAQTRQQRGGWRSWGGAAALVAAGLVAGGVLAGTLTASADSGTGGTTGSYAASSPGAPSRGGSVDESKSQRPDEHLLSGDTASKVRAAALAKYPGATIQRVETDSDGVYEAHLLTASGQRVTVEVGKDFTVTGNEAAPGGPRMHAGDGGASSQGTTTQGT
jgi:hypothetical protein